MCGQTTELLEAVINSLRQGPPVWITTLLSASTVPGTEQALPPSESLCFLGCREPTTSLYPCLRGKLLSNSPGCRHSNWKQFCLLTPLPLAPHPLIHSGLPGPPAVGPNSTGAHHAPYLKPSP